MSDSTNVTRILLVDPNVLFRCGIARLLDSQQDFCVVGQTGNYMEVADLVAHLQPDLILIETELDGCDGVTLVGLLHQRFPSISLIFLTSEVQSDLVLECIVAGAVGYLQKNITPEELFARLRSLNYGAAAMSPRTVRVLMDRLSASKYLLQSCGTPDPVLTPREWEILSRVARGLTNKQIGESLQISEHTVRNHLGNVYQKLNLRNRLQAAVYSVIHGLADLENLG